MEYYRDRNVTIRPLEEGDCAALARAFAAQGWHKPEEQYRRYLGEQQQACARCWWPCGRGSWRGT